MTATVREASTVVLLRDAPDGLETWLLRRVPKMAFAPGMSVFPGGGVDPIDTDGAEPDNLAESARQLAVPPERAAVLLRCAAREIAEETDVVLPLESIRPWARWITPVSEPRRYDTYFFVAAVPAGSVAAAVTGEASHADWIPIAQALAEYDRGERPMLPPTIVNLTEIGLFGSTAEVLAAATSRTVAPVEPDIRREPDGTLVADLGDGRVLPLPANFIGASGRAPT